MRSSNTTSSAEAEAPPSSSDDDTGRFPPAARRPWFPPVAAALAYGGMHLFWYWRTPLGMSPALDERENIELAIQIAAGSLPAEPFYRAMGYPLLLSAFPAMGATEASLPFLATALGLALHGLCAGLACLIALRIFASKAAALIAGLVYALHPVLVHYSTQILDGALANAAFLAGLLLLLRGAGAPPGPRTVPPRTVSAATAAMCFWTAAALTRPQFFVLLPLFPLAWMILHPSPVRLHLKPLAGSGAAMLALLGLFGLWQLRVCGEFRVMPTQGAYNLWSANRPGADGRYFTQSIHIPATEAHRNPARVESHVLHERETGRAANSIDEENAHWRRRLRNALVDDPAAWAGLLARKTYHLLNDFDAYNNKTYAFHKARSPWLRPNPLGWGVVLVAAGVGYRVLFAGDRRVARAVLLTAVFVAGGIILTLVSGRFRVPLLSLGCVLSGGAALAPRLPRQARFGAVLAAVALAAISFSDFAGAKDTRTFVQDHLLTAHACLRIGDDQGAWSESGNALLLRPDHPDGLATRVAAGFNLLLTPEPPRDFDPAKWRDASARLLATSATADPHLLAISILGAGDLAPVIAPGAGRGLPSQLRSALRILSTNGRVSEADHEILITSDAKTPLIVRLAVALIDGPRTEDVESKPEREAATRLRDRLRAIGAIKDPLGQEPADKNADSGRRPDNN